MAATKPTTSTKPKKAPLGVKRPSEFFRLEIAAELELIDQTNGFPAELKVSSTGDGGELVEIEFEGRRFHVNGPNLAVAVNAALDRKID